MSPPPRPRLQRKTKKAKRPRRNPTPRARDPRAPIPRRKPVAATKAMSTEEWIEELKSISVLELSERIKALEEEFGVSATAVAAAAPAGGGGGGDAAEAEEEQTAFDVVL